jgi:hypothetical protein
MIAVLENNEALKVKMSTKAIPTVKKLKVKTSVKYCEFFFVEKNFFFVKILFIGQNCLQSQTYSYYYRQNLMRQKNTRFSLKSMAVPEVN